MRKFIIQTIKYGILGIISCTVLILGGYFYLTENLKSADTPAESVPYSFSSPENKGIMIDVNGDKTFIYLDFTSEKLSVIIPPEKEFEGEIYGYPIDFNITADYRFLSSLIDYSGGIVLNLEGEDLRYTGVQVTDILSHTTETEELKREIILSLLKTVGENGIDNEVFKYIVEETETDITIPDSYYWGRYIKKLSAGGSIIN